MPHLISFLKRLAALALPLLIGTSTMAQAQPPKADIILHLTGNHLSIEDEIWIPEDGDYKVQLEVRKTGKGGRATTHQGNSIKGEADHVYQTSHMHLVLGHGDHIEAKLSLFSKDSLLVTTTRNYTFDAPAPDTHNHL